MSDVLWDLYLRDTTIAAASMLEPCYLLWLYLRLNILSSLLCIPYLLCGKFMLPTISRKIRMRQRSCQSLFFMGDPFV